MSIIDQLNDDSLVRLVQTGNEVGRIYSIDYENALVLTNDLWKSKVNGVPQNAFLIATNIVFFTSKIGSSHSCLYQLHVF